jgi:hypothetical protein
MAAEGLAAEAVAETRGAAPRHRSSSLTQAGSVMGTPDYIAPEQIQDARQIDIRADIYSLGCTLYYLVSGRVPFPGGTHVDKLLAHRERQPEPLTKHRPDVPPRVLAVLSRMLAKSPAERYQTPGQVAAALDDLAERVRVGGPAIPMVLPATTAAVAAHAATASLPGVLTPQQAPRRRRWPIVLGCLFSGIILSGLAIVAVVLAVQYAIRSVGETVSDVAKSFKEEVARDEVWNYIEADWRAPPLDLAADKLFPRYVEGFTRQSNSDNAALAELRLRDGRQGFYRSSTGSVEVFVFAMPAEERETFFADVKRTIEGKSQQAMRMQRSSSGGKASRYMYSLGLPNNEQGVFWWCDGRLFHARSYDGGDPGAFLLRHVRAIDQKPTPEKAKP